MHVHSSRFNDDHEKGRQWIMIWKRQWLKWEEMKGGKGIENDDCSLREISLPLSSLHINFMGNSCKHFMMMTVDDFFSTPILYNFLIHYYSSTNLTPLLFTLIYFLPLAPGQELAISAFLEQFLRTLFFISIYCSNVAEFDYQCHDDSNETFLSLSLSSLIQVL